MIEVLDTLIPDAIQRRLFPGAVVLIARDGQIVYHAAYGSTMYEDPGSQPVRLETIYDIASLTKMFTATVALQLLDAGMLSLDDPVQRYLPDLCTDEVTIRHLLTHTSGIELRLSSLRDQSPDAIWAAIYQREPAHPPGTLVSYVNISTLLLGAVIEAIAHHSLDHVIQELISTPLRLQQTGFCPPAERRPHIAPSEDDIHWRGGLVHGRVNDDSAHALGGVAGHAGLFSTATDLWCFVQMWLDDGTYQGKRLLQSATVAQATQIQTAGLAFVPPYGGSPDTPFYAGLGWMIDRPNIMGHAPAGSYGHTGFTGPTMIAVPAQRLAVIMLSNRTYPHRPRLPVHHATTAALVDAALQA
ncbi:MAG: beta-lactamase family protein [Chloroflexaceae bacterium]|nr:beta-lactamase family protein [Chloroflexaceae bacterium]